MANGMGQGTGARDRRSGETVRRGHGETENLRITHHASRITHYALRITTRGDQK